jgi:hypothetical protein
MRASAIQNRWSPAIAHAAIADVVIAAERAFGPWTHRVRSLGRECYECYANGSSYRAHLSGLRTWNVFRDGQYRVQLKTIPEVETFINHDAGDVAQGRETLNAPHVEPSIAEPTTEAELVPDVVR